MRDIALIGSAFGYGAQITTTSLGPCHIKEQCQIVSRLIELGIDAYWHQTVMLENADLSDVPNKGKHFKAVLEHNRNLYQIVKNLVLQKKENIPFVIGGDHSCAIGTWSGVIDALNAHEDFGLIWIDAHMDAHIFETSPSKAYHGMPLSILLGRGDKDLANIGLPAIKIAPKHLVLIGVRSYEPEEAAFLQAMGVKIFTCEETQKRGIAQVFQEALAIVKQAKQGFGISFDLDAIDPLEAPGVGSPEKDGLKWQEVKKHFQILFRDKKFKAIEVTELNPERDKQNMTAEILLQTAQQLGLVLTSKLPPVMEVIS